MSPADWRRVQFSLGAYGSDPYMVRVGQDGVVERKRASDAGWEACGMPEDLLARLNAARLKYVRRGK